MPMKSVPLLVFTLLIPGCFGGTVALSPEAKSVTLVRASDRPLHCKPLGKITGSSKSTDAKLAKAGAENDFRNQAAELQANYAFIEAERSGPVGTSSQHDAFIGGKALRCQTEAMEDAADKAAAEKKADETAAEEKPAP